MLWLQIILLAVVQGLTEFLPISSSGHLVIVQEIFEQAGHPLPQRLTVDVVLHLGTLLSILVFFRRRIAALFFQDRRVIGLLLAGSVPAGAAGLLLKEQFEAAFDSPLLVGCMLLGTGALLLWARRQPPGIASCRELGYVRAVVIGLFQALAILPGISRSGSTITAGIVVGLRRDEAAVFSFLLAIPAIAGAGLVDFLHYSKSSGDSTPVLVLLVGAAVSFLVGLLALWLLIRWLRRGRLHLFAGWVILLGTAVIAWQLAVQ